jgi:hypothetical protein
MPSRQSNTRADYLLLAEALCDIWGMEEASAAAGLPKPAAVAAFAGAALVSTPTRLPPPAGEQPPPPAMAAADAADAAPPAPWPVPLPPGKGDNTMATADHTIDFMDIEDAMDFLLSPDSADELGGTNEEALPSMPECEGLFWVEEAASSTNSSSGSKEDIAAF